MFVVERLLSLIRRPSPTPGFTFLKEPVAGSLVDNRLTNPAAPQNPSGDRRHAVLPLQVDLVLASHSALRVAPAAPLVGVPADRGELEVRRRAEGEPGGRPHGEHRAAPDGVVGAEVRLEALPLGVASEPGGEGAEAARDVVSARGVDRAVAAVEHHVQRQSRREHSGHDAAVVVVDHRRWEALFRLGIHDVVVIVQVIPDARQDLSADRPKHGLIEADEPVLQVILELLGLRGAQTVGGLRGVQVPPVTLKQELVPRAENVRARHDVELLLGGVADGDTGRGGAGRRRRPQPQQCGGRNPEQHSVGGVDRERRKHREHHRRVAVDHGLGCRAPGPSPAGPSSRAERRPAVRCPAPRPGLVPARSAGAAAPPAERDAGRAAWGTLWHSGVSAHCTLVESTLDGSPVSTPCLGT